MIRKIIISSVALLALAGIAGCDRPEQDEPTALPEYDRGSSSQPRPDAAPRADDPSTAKSDKPQP